MSAILHADWPPLRGVHAFTTLRYGAGVSEPPFDRFNMGLRCGDLADAVMVNRRELVDACGLPSEPRWLRQVHGKNIVRMDALASPAFVAEGAEADASVTSMSGIVLAILTADCLPVVFASEDDNDIAAAHAGWRGLAGGVLEATVAAMQASPAKIIAWLGPAAGPDVYEIGEEVFDTFVSRDAHAESAFKPTRPGHWHADLYALARMRLAGAGVTRVHGGNMCTISDPARFYSHRRDQRSGRMATLIWRD